MSACLKYFVWSLLVSHFAVDHTGRIVAAETTLEDGDDEETKLDEITEADESFVGLINNGFTNAEEYEDSEKEWTTNDVCFQVETPYYSVQENGKNDDEHIKENMPAKVKTDPQYIPGQKKDKNKKTEMVNLLSEDMLQVEDRKCGPLSNAMVHVSNEEQFAFIHYGHNLNCQDCNMPNFPSIRNVAVARYKLRNQKHKMHCVFAGYILLAIITLMYALYRLKWQFDQQN